MLMAALLACSCVCFAGCDDGQESSSKKPNHSNSYYDNEEEWTNNH